jgi:hypothetical protein
MWALIRTDAVSWSLATLAVHATYLFPEMRGAADESIDAWW